METEKNKAKKVQKMNENIKTYEEIICPAMQNKDYNMVYEILKESPDVIGYLTKSQGTYIIQYLLKRNNKMITEMKSSLEKTLNKLDNMDKIK